MARACGEVALEGAMLKGSSPVPILWYAAPTNRNFLNDITWVGVTSKKGTPKAVSIDCLLQHISLRDSVRACHPLVVSGRERLIIVHPAHEQQAVYNSITQSLPYSVRASGYLS
jgi:hypothetical protein